ncbi:MAG TPA: hypothetical protein VJ836_03355 [Candidatus Saccharimonadales bacterium]|nr:hypothetical protein [Candidatus Saccharimonadales bacterium]
MDKFDLQIAVLKPTKKGPARLDATQFMKKLDRVKRARQMQQLVLALIAMTVLVIIAGAVRRDILDVLSLTINYFNELPSMLKAYSDAYLATVPLPSVISVALLAGLGIGLMRLRKSMAAYSKRTYQYATAVGVLALGLGIVGLLSSPAHAVAQQEALRRQLNQRGHLEVEVSGKDYELYGQSQATDDSIRYQALIEELRILNISKAYPELTNMNRDGFVVEIRAVNTKDGCIYYVERRLEPALNQVLDANSGCIRSDTPVYYVSSQLKPTKMPKWEVGQALYLTSARKKDAPANSPAGHAGIAIILEGKADQYIARSNGEKLVPKGQPGTGVQSCGIDRQEVCPNVGLVDVFTNAEGQLASGEIGSSVPGDSLRPRAGTGMVNVFGKITSMDDHSLRLQTLSGKKVAIAWPRNYIKEFNAQGAANYPTATGPLYIQTGDHLEIIFYYKDAMDLQRLSISDVVRINLAIKTTLPDSLQNEPYSKEKAGQIEKY